MGKIRWRIEYLIFAVLGFCLCLLGGCQYPNARIFTSNCGPLTVNDSSYTGPTSATSTIEPTTNVPTPGAASISAGLSMPTQNVTAQPGSTVNGSGGGTSPILQGAATK